MNRVPMVTYDFVIFREMFNAWLLPLVDFFFFLVRIVFLIQYLEDFNLFEVFDEGI